MDTTLSAKFVEWQQRNATTNKSIDNKDQKQKKDKKDKTNKKLTRGNKVTLDFEDESKSLLKCFFGDAEGVEDFRTHHFQRHPVVSRNHDISEVKQVLFNLNVKELLSNTSSDQIHVWMKSMDSEALNSITVGDAEQGVLLFQAGHSLYCRAPPHFEQIVVPQLTKELSYGIDIANNDRFRRGEVEMFHSRKGHFTDFHTDFQENFTIQLSGVKKWIFATSSATHPIRGCTPHFNQSQDKDLVEQQLKILKLGDCKFSPAQFKDNGDHTEIILHPGDVMYHPAGIWHRVECLEDSMSLNISLTAVSFADVFCTSLQQLLMENPLWRSSVFHEDHLLQQGGRPSAEQIMKSIIEAVPALVQTLNPADVLPFPTMRNKLSREEAKKSLFVEGDSVPNKQGEEEEEDDDNSGSEAGEDEEEEMEMESMEGSDMDDLVEELENEDEDEDEGNDTAASTQLVVHVQNIDMESCGVYFSATSTDSSKEVVGSKKRKTSSGDVLTRSFKFNPFAMILEKDDDDIYRFVVHCGYGNETLESAARAVLLIPAEMKIFMKKVLAQYESERVQRREHFLAINEQTKASMKSNVEYKAVVHSLADLQAINGKLKEKLSDEDLMRVVYGLKLVGALTFL